MRRCRSTVPAVPARSSPASSDLPHHKAVSRGLRGLATTDSSSSPPRLPAFSPRPISPEPPLQTGPSDSTDLLGARRIGQSGACGQGRGGRDLVLDRIPRGLRQLANAIVTPSNMRLKLAGARARVGRIALPRQPAFLSAAPLPCADGGCARSLSAIR